MAASGKKSKKAKWVKANLTDILAEPTTIPTSNWAAAVDEETESYGYGSRTRAPVVLPSASRAARGGLAVDDESIPRRPPYIAHISNLPYDVDESAITELFEGLKITNLRLPREGERLKGFGYVDFEDRESLVSAMNIADLTISGRRIRIEVATQENDRRMGRGGMGRSDRDREYDPERTMGDWRSGPRAAPDPQARAARPTERDERRERPPDRERDSSADNKPGGWRDGDRPAAAPEPARTPYGGRDSFGRDRFGEDRGREQRGYGGRDGFRTAERDSTFGGNREGRGFGGRSFGDRDRDRDRDPPPRDDMKPRERPKLNLLPRTVPRDLEVPTKPADGASLDKDEKQPEKPKPVTAEKVFGAAKPVDTAAKEREIEERLLKQEEEARRGGDDKERWGSRRNDHSDDRRAGARRDDRPRDSRSFNRERRDYSKDDKDRRNDRDRRDYSKDGRERRDYSKDDKDRRDYRDDRDRRDDGQRGDDKRRDDRVRRDYSDERRRDPSRERDGSRERRDHSRGRDDSRERRRPDSRDRDAPRGREREREAPRDRSRERDAPRDRSRERDAPRDRSRERDAPRDRSRERDAPRDHSRERDAPRDRSRERDVPRDRSRERDAPRDRSRDQPNDERNGRDRPSRSHDRHDDAEDKPLPKLKEQEKPNFVASNKFSFLEDADDGGSD